MNFLRLAFLLLVFSPINLYSQERGTIDGVPIEDYGIQTPAPKRPAEKREIVNPFGTPPQPELIRQVEPIITPTTARPLLQQQNARPRPMNANACNTATNEAEKWCTGDSSIMGGGLAALSTMLPQLGNAMASNDMKKTCDILKGTTGLSAAANSALSVKCWRAINACKTTCAALSANSFMQNNSNLSNLIVDRRKCEELANFRFQLLGQAALSAVNVKRMRDSCKQMESDQTATAADGNISPEECGKPEHFHKPTCICLRDPASPRCTQGPGGNMNPPWQQQNQNKLNGEDNFDVEGLLGDDTTDNFGGQGTAGSGGGFSPPGGGGGGLGGGGGGAGGSGGEGAGGGSGGSPDYDTDIVGGVQSAGGGGGAGGSGGGGYSDGTASAFPSSGLDAIDSSSSSFFDLKKFLPGGEKAKQRNIASVNNKTSSSGVSEANGESNFQKVTRTINEKRGILLP